MLGVKKPWLKAPMLPTATRPGMNNGKTKWTKASPVRGGKGSAQTSIPANFSVNPNKRFTGSVNAYWKFQGYGFIEPDQGDALPGGRVFVHWKDISSSDRFPSLVKETRVQFSLIKFTKEDGVTQLRAANVTGEFGEELSVQDEADAKKNYVGGQQLRYTGVLKFFSPKNGFGYIKIDDGYDYGAHQVPKEIRAETAELNCGGAHPKHINEETQVEFGIWVTKKGVFKAYNVTSPGGVPLEGEV